MTIRVARHTLALTLVLGLASSTAWGQSAQEPRAAAWGAVAFALPTSGGTLESRYAPPLSAGSLVNSSASQSLGVDTGAAIGGIGGVDVYLGRHVGVQVAYDRSTAGIEGPEGTHMARVRYVAQPPPLGVPQEIIYDRTSPWPAAAGDLTTSALSIGAVGRWRSSGRAVGGTVSGGMSLLRFSGDIEGVALTRFVLGGHSTLLPVTHAVRMAPDDATAWRPYVGADVDVRLAPRIALFGGLRATLGSDITVATVPDGLVDPSQGPFAPDDAELRRLLGTQPLTLPGTRVQVLAGLKLFVG